MQSRSAAPPNVRRGIIIDLRYADTPYRYRIHLFDRDLSAPLCPQKTDSMLASRVCKTTYSQELIALIWCIKAMEPPRQERKAASLLLFDIERCLGVNRP